MRCWIAILRPELSPDAAARIRFRLGSVRAGHRRLRFFGWATVAAAAVALIVVLFGGSESLSPVQTESRSLARVEPSSPVSAPAAPRNLPGYLANLWDDTSRTESDESFVALKIELDNIAAMIEAVSFKKNDVSQDCVSDGEETEWMENKINTTDFWQG